jgi:hypothetical protein
VRFRGGGKGEFGGEVLLRLNGRLLWKGVLPRWFQL